MRTIINPVKWMLRRGELIAMRAKAIKDHKAHADIDRELIEVTAALIAWQDRQEAKSPDWIEKARQAYARNYFESGRAA